MDNNQPASSANAAQDAEIVSGNPPEATVHIHIDLDSDAGMQQAQDALKAIFSTVTQGPAQQAAPVVPAVVAPPASLPTVQLPYPMSAMSASTSYSQPAAASTPPTLSMDMASIQQLLNYGTPGRRRGPGRPSRAETELRALFNNVAGAAAASPAGPIRIACKMCNQPKADSLLRNCGHQVCRTCVLPYINIRPVCPLRDCAQATFVQDIIPIGGN